MAEGSQQQPGLSACDREPIHIPGAIQPHGILLTLDPQLRICRHAGDLDAFLKSKGDPTGKRLNDLLDTGRLEIDAKSDQAEHVGVVEGPIGHPLDLFIHRSGDHLIVELEPAPRVRRTGAEVLRDLLPIVSGIGAASDVIAASNEAAAGVRRITGYDRVMVYRFLEDGSGQVIAEARSDDADSFLHHRYPASDIPQQARALYLRNPIRVIPDVDYRPAEIVGGEGALDLSGSLLRSVSPIHVEYLKNMGVAASASVSLVQDGDLWGLIACHSRFPKPIAHEEREMCRQVAVALDQAIGRLEEENTQREALRLTRRREELLPIIAAADGIAAGMRANVEELRRLVSADGIALLLDNEIVCSGATPPERAMGDLAGWLLKDSPREFLATNELSQLYFPAADWCASASGLLSCIVRRSPTVAILWFRAEEIETVNWAGNPHKAVEWSTSADQLTPRKSFDLWSETVRGRSRRWRRNEEDAGRRVAAALGEIGRQKTLTELNRQLAGEVAEKDLLMREVHHRVQNSLQLVISMLHLQEKDLEEEGARKQLELARDRVLSVALLHRRLWRSEDLESINLETFFGELMEGLLRTWSEDWRQQLTLDVAPVRLPANEALLIALIVSELLTNAVKHAYGGGAGPLRLTAREAGKSCVAITIADRGIGTTGEVRPGSFGSRLVQGLVRNIGAELKLVSNNPGTSATLLVPISSAH